MPHFVFLALIVLACSPPPGASLQIDRSQQSVSEPLATETGHAAAAKLSETLTRYASHAASPPPACDSQYMAAHLRARRHTQGTRACADLARQCGMDKLDVPSLLQAALCNGSKTRIAHLEEILQRTPNAKGYDIVYAELALAHFEAGRKDQARQALARNPEWSADDQSLIFGLIDFNSVNGAANQSSAQLDDFVSRELARASGEYRDFLFQRHLFNLVQIQYRPADGIHFFARNQAFDPGTYNPSLYKAFFDLRNRAGFRASAAYHRAYAPFFNPSSATVEQSNPFTYTELYTSECATGLLQGPNKAGFDQLTSSWLAGRIPLATAADQVRNAWLPVVPTADVLTFAANLDQIQGNLDAAENRYFQALRICPFYFRAMAGIRELRTLRKLNGDSNSAEVFEKRRKAVAEVAIPPSIGTFIGNYNSLNEESRIAALWALRFWLPYVDFLLAKGGRAYVKQNFQLLSQVPGAEFLRDSRVEKDNDFRLRDDLPGIATNGLVVTSDIANRGVIFGEYNIAGHETSHTFQHASPNIEACVKKLYAAAKARKVFANSYSETNDSEYFAEAVTFYYERSASKRPSMPWYRANDPLLADFLDQIASARNPPDRIPCPIQ